MSFENLIILAIVAAIFILLHWINSRVWNFGGSDAAGRTADKKESLYVIADSAVDFFQASAHPADLTNNAEFKRGVTLLRQSGFAVEELVTYISGDNAVIAAMAAEALRRRADGPSMSERVLTSVGSVGPWPLHFVLQYLASVTPPEQSLIGRVLPRATMFLEFPFGRLCLETFIRERLAGGEAVDFGEDLDRLAEPEVDALHGFLEGLEPALGECLLEAFKRWQDERIDFGMLRSVGFVWDESKLEESKRIVEHEALDAALDELAGAFLADKPRSVLLVGESGVGKTALMARLAARLYEQGWIIFQAGHAELIAGQVYMGQFEERLKSLLGQLRGERRILWLIPGFPALAYSGQHQYSPVSALDIILPYIEMGEIKILGESQPSTYERLVQRHRRVGAALTTKRIHSLGDEATLELARDWMAARTSGSEEEGVVLEAWALAQQFLGQMAPPGNLLKLLEVTGDRLLRRSDSDQLQIGVDDLIVTLAELTGLPQGLLDQKQPLDLDALRTLFNERVLGQSEAVDCLVERVAMIKAGVTDPTRPAGVFLFAGPSGTGKTEVAKTLAEWLFRSSKRMIRIDMSELQTPQSLDRLLGGEDAGNTAALVDLIREQPFSVVLLDEFEKAHQNVWDLFLQVFDDARLTDRRGQTADFRHAIIILTSNVGSSVPIGDGIGFLSGNVEFEEDEVLRAVGQTFRKEFLNRLDRIVVFRPLKKALMRQILEKEIDAGFQRRGLRMRSWAVEWDEAAIDFLLEKGFTRDLGARPLKRAVERYLLTPLAVTIVSLQAPEGDQFLFVSRKGDGLEVQFVDPDTADVPADTAEQDAALQGGDVEQDPATRPLKPIVLHPRGTGDEFAALRAHFERLEARVSGTPWRERKSAAISLMESPDFWDSSARFEILDQIEYLGRIEFATECARSLLRRLIGRSNASRAYYPPDLVGRLAQSLYLIETACVDFEDGQPHDAFLRVETGRSHIGDFPRSRDFARELAQMYRAWSKNRNMRLRVLEETHDETAARYRFVAAVSGFGAYSILKEESGIHVLEEPGRNPKKPDRYTVEIQVAAHDNESAAQTGPALRQQAGQALAREEPKRKRIVRRYRRGPSPLVRDNLHGWRSGRLDQVLAGNFDLFAAQ